MPAKKTYVHVAKFGVNEIFDQQYKSKLPALMQKTATQLVEKSKALTAKPPKDKKEEGFYLDGALSRLVKVEKGGKTILAGEMKLQMATWPKKSMFAFPSGAAKIEAGRPDDLKGDVEYLVVELVRSVMTKQAIKEFERRAK